MNVSSTQVINKLTGVATRCIAIILYEIVGEQKKSNLLLHLEKIYNSINFMKFLIVSK